MLKVIINMLARIESRNRERHIETIATILWTSGKMNAGEARLFAEESDKVIEENFPLTDSKDDK